MNQAEPLSWHEANQRYLMAELSILGQLLDRYEAQVVNGGSAPDELRDRPQEMIEPIRSTMPAPAALDTLCTTFNLSPFERAILLLCAGGTRFRMGLQVCSCTGRCSPVTSHL